MGGGEGARVRVGVRVKGEGEVKSRGGGECECEGEGLMVLPLPCPAQVCSPTGPGTYDVKAWTHQKTVLTVTVKPRVCSDGGGERNQVTVAWTQLNLKENGRCVDVMVRG